MVFFLYTIIFMIGALTGSFCTLAVYRLPLKKDITHERSFCPNCNHKLKLLDLIPILSYVFLGGKCRYCKQKIRPRYLILEVFAGLTAVIFAISFKFSFTSFEVSKIICLFLGMLYITGQTIIAGIDKENKQILKSMLIFNWVVTALYIIYLFIVGMANINRYAIYLFFMLTLTCIYLLDKKQKRKKPYAFYICIINIILMIIQNYVLYYFI